MLKKLSENKKKCLEDGLDERLKLYNVNFDDFYKKMTTYIHDKFSQQKNYFDKRFDKYGAVIDRLRTNLIMISSRFSQSVSFKLLSSNIIFWLLHLLYIIIDCFRFYFLL